MAPPTFAGLSGRPLSLTVSTVATMAFLLFGYDQGVMSGIISSPVFNDYFPETRDSTMQGLVTAIYEIGCLIGAMFILAVGDLLGRRKAIIIGGIIMIFGTIIQVTCMRGHAQLAQLIIGRIVTSVGNGINTSPSQPTRLSAVRHPTVACSSVSKVASLPLARSLPIGSIMALHTDPTTWSGDSPLPSRLSLPSSSAQP